MKGLKVMAVGILVLVFAGKIYGILGFGLEPEVDFISQDATIIAKNPDQNVDVDVDMGKSAAPGFRLTTRVGWSRFVVDFVPSSFKKEQVLTREIKLPGVTFHVGEEVETEFVKKVAGGALRAHLPIPFITIEPGIGIDLWIDTKISAYSNLRQSEYKVAEFILLPSLAFKLGANLPMFPLGVYVEGKWIELQLKDKKPSYLTYRAGIRGGLPVSIPFLAKLHYLAGYKYDSLKLEKEHESYEIKSKGIFAGLSISLF